jgi:hypothetical protein
MKMSHGEVGSVGTALAGETGVVLAAVGCTEAARSGAAAAAEEDTGIAMGENADLL